MVDVSGVPNLGIPGLSGFSGGAPNNGGYFADPGAGLNNAYASQASNSRFFGNQAATPSTVPQSQLYGPQGFGGATAQAAATGAAYGRNTGGFNAVGGVTKPVGAPSGGSVFDTGSTPVPYLNSPPPGSFSPSPNYPGGSRGAIAQSMMPPTPDFSHAFGQFPQGQTPTQAQNQPAINAVNQFSGRGTGVGAFDAPSSQPSPFDLAHGAFPSSSGSFADRFAPVMGGNPGTPSQYYTGSQYPGAQAPPRGFQTPFSADNPGGALPVGWGPFQPKGAPMMNASPDDEPSQDTLSPRDRAIGQGSGGGFYPTPFNPGQFAPSSPFGSGGGVSAGRGTQMPNTVQPFFGGGGSGFGTPGSTHGGGQYGGRGGYPALIGSPADQYGNPFIQGNASPFAQGIGRMGGGVGLGGLDALGQGTVFRGSR